jgi:hypothetical protein
MAVTILQAPQTLTPSDNDVRWVWSSNQSTQPNFEYKIEVRVNSVLIYVGKVFPIQSAVSYYNASELLRALVFAPTINSSPVVGVGNTTDLRFANTSVAAVQLTVIERYGSPIANQASSSSTVTVWKSALDEKQWLGYDYTDFTTPIFNFLTNFPRGQRYEITRSQNNYLLFFWGATGNILCSTGEDDESFPVLTTGMQFANVNIEDITTALGLIFEQQAIFSIRNSSNVVVSEELKFNIIEPCANYRTLFFLNKLGGIDSWTFTARKTKNREYERSTYKKKLGRLVNGVYVYNEFDGREQNFHNKTDKTETITSDWMHPDVHDWLCAELLESPLVWEEDETGNKHRVNVQNSSSETVNENNAVWLQIAIEIKSSLQSYSVTI